MVVSDARKALLLARHVKNLINVEVKNHDVQQTAVAFTNTGVITQLSNIAQGDTTITRDGAQCKVIGIYLAYFLQVSATAPRTAVRIMLVLDKQMNQAIYTIGDLLEDVTGSDILITPRNLDNKHRFTVLYDKNHNLSTANSTVVVRKYIKRNILLRYDASVPDITDLT